MKTRNEETFVEKCREFERLYSQGRIEESVERFYAPDAILEGTGLPAQVGRRMIRTLFEDVRNRYERIELAIDAFGVSENIAYCRQTNTNYCHDGSIERHKGIMIWNLVDGDWLVKIDLFYFLGDTDPEHFSFDEQITEFRNVTRKTSPLY